MKLTLSKISIIMMASIFGLTACSDNSSDSSSSTAANSDNAAPLHIGFIASATGAAAAYGEAHDTGTRLAIEEINKAGGFNGQPITATFEDDKSDPTTGINAAKKLLTQKNVDAIIGSSASLVTIAFSKENEKMKVPLLNGMAGSPTITNQGYQYTWRINITDNQLNTKAIEHFIQKDQIKKIAFLVENSDYGKPPTQAAANRAKELGAEVLAYEEYNRGETDFKAQLSNIKKLNPELIFVHGYYTEGSIIARQIKELGISAKLVINMGQGVPKFVELAGDAAEGTVFPTTWVPGLADERSKNFEAAFKAKYNKEPGAFEAGSYEAVYTIVEAAKRGGGARPEQIQKGLQQMKGFDTLIGPLAFDEKNQNDGQARLAGFKGGVIVPVE